DAVIVLDDGLGVQNSVPPEALHVLLRLDGRRTVRELVVEIADETGLDVEMLAATAVECLRQLAVRGLVQRVASP
ncbi:MAG: PqqD family peptide modification chaperone, partial [Actinobacteria bacterium]|nr:PqqD family peptide modification chaperone [Actinomycetota bacterium]